MNLIMYKTSSLVSYTTNTDILKYFLSLLSPDNSERVECQKYRLYLAILKFQNIMGEWVPENPDF